MNTIIIADEFLHTGFLVQHENATKTSKYSFCNSDPKINYLPPKQPSPTTQETEACYCHVYVFVLCYLHAASTYELSKRHANASSKDAFVIIYSR